MSDAAIPDFSTFKVKELKEYITTRGGSLAGLAEKGDLINKCKELQSSMPAMAKAAPTAAGAASGSSAPAGALPCKTWDSYSSGETPDFVIFLMHGLNADNSQFDGWGQMLLSQPKLKGKKLRVVSPQAGPRPPNTSAWFDLDMMAWFMAFNGGEAALGVKLREVPGGLTDSGEALRALVKSQMSETGLPLNKIFLGGFSQGASAAMEASLGMDGDVGGILFFSGVPVNVDGWAAGAKKHTGLKILQMHGKNDPMLPFHTSHWVKDMMSGAGLQVTFQDHDGAHDFGDPNTSLAAVGNFLASAL